MSLNGTFSHGSVKDGNPFYTIGNAWKMFIQVKMMLNCESSGTLPLSLKSEYLQIGMIRMIAILRLTMSDSNDFTSLTNDLRGDTSLSLRVVLSSDESLGEFNLPEGESLTSEVSWIEWDTAWAKSITVPNLV
jgi:hypothetical protein